LTLKNQTKLNRNWLVGTGFGLNFFEKQNYLIVFIDKNQTKNNNFYMKQRAK